MVCGGERAVSHIRLNNLYRPMRNLKPKVVTATPLSRILFACLIRRRSTYHALVHVWKKFIVADSAKDIRSSCPSLPRHTLGKCSRGFQWSVMMATTSTSPSWPTRLRLIGWSLCKVAGQGRRGYRQCSRWSPSNSALESVGLLRNALGIGCLGFKTGRANLSFFFPLFILPRYGLSSPLLQHTHQY